MNKDLPVTEPIILFDGICNFCAFWVQFAIKRNNKRNLKFAPLQGVTAKKILSLHNLDTAKFTTIVLVDGGKVYTHSSAALRICKYLDGAWKLFYYLIIIPKFLRDVVYNIIAKNRYKWFGKKESCMIVTPDLKGSFMD